MEPTKIPYIEAIKFLPKLTQENYEKRTAESLQDNVDFMKDHLRSISVLMTLMCEDCGIYSSNINQIRRLGNRVIPETILNNPKDNNSVSKTCKRIMKYLHDRLEPKDLENALHKLNEFGVVDVLDTDQYKSSGIYIEYCNSALDLDESYIKTISDFGLIMMRSTRDVYNSGHIYFLTADYEFQETTLTRNAIINSINEVNKVLIALNCDKLTKPSVAKFYNRSVALSNLLQNRLNMMKDSMRSTVEQKDKSCKCYDIKAFLTTKSNNPIKMYVGGIGLWLNVTSNPRVAYMQEISGSAGYMVLKDLLNTKAIKCPDLQELPNVNTCIIPILDHIMQENNVRYLFVKPYPREGKILTEYYGFKNPSEEELKFANYPCNSYFSGAMHLVKSYDHNSTDKALPTALNHTYASSSSSSAAPQIALNHTYVGSGSSSMSSGSAASKLSTTIVIESSDDDEPPKKKRKISRRHADYIVIDDSE